MASKRQAIKGLLNQMTDQSTRIQNYNFRHFFLRKTVAKHSYLDSLSESDLE